MESEVFGYSIGHCRGKGFKHAQIESVTLRKVWLCL